MGGVNNRYEPSLLNKQSGVGGVLYPPHSLHPEVSNEKVFMDICPHADDLWFYAMAVMAGTKVVGCPVKGFSNDEFLTNWSVQDSALWHINNAQEKGQALTHDNAQLKAILDRYQLWEKLSKEG